jgi:hypothetical protein
LNDFWHLNNQIQELALVKLCRQAFVTALCLRFDKEMNDEGLKLAKVLHPRFRLSGRLTAVERDRMVEKVKVRRTKLPHLNVSPYSFLFSGLCLRISRIPLKTCPFCPHYELLSNHFMDSECAVYLSSEFLSKERLSRYV